MAEWISVKDRLPENNKFVLVHKEYGYDIATYRRDERWENQYGKLIRASHWMPLPSQPKGE